MQIYDRVALSQEYCAKGYNCAQSVAASFTDLIGLDEDTVMKISSSFGSGIGKLKEVCGAITGMAIVAGILYGSIDPNNHDDYLDHYKLVYDLADEFKANHGSVICRELLGMAEEEGMENKAFCSILIADAVRILSEFIENKKH